MDNQKLLAILRTAQRDHDTTGFNEFDFMHAFGSGREALLYARLFWPQFVEYNDMVFLSSTAEGPEDKRRIDETLRSYGGDRVKTEESFNVVEIPILFGRRIAETTEEEVLDGVDYGSMARPFAASLSKPRLSNEDSRTQ